MTGNELVRVLLSEIAPEDREDQVVILNGTTLSNIIGISVIERGNKSYIMIK